MCSDPRVRYTTPPDSDNPPLPYDPRIKLITWDGVAEKLVQYDRRPFRRPDWGVSAQQVVAALAGVPPDQNGVRRFEDIGKYGIVRTAGVDPDNIDDPYGQRFSDAEFLRDSIWAAWRLGPELPKQTQAERAAGEPRVYADRLTHVTVKHFTYYDGLSREEVSIAQQRFSSDEIAKRGLKLEEYDWREEEEGAGVHEIRDPVNDPVAIHMTREDKAGWPRYTTADGTILKALLMLRMGRDDARAFQEPQVRRDLADGHTLPLGLFFKRNLKWLESHMGKSGLIELEPLSITRKDGTRMLGALSGWKDSWDAYSDAKTGRIPTGRVALLLVNALAYQLFHETSVFAHRNLGVAQEFGLDAARYGSLALRVRYAVLTSMWVADKKGPFFASAMECDDKGNVSPIMARTSDMGFVLTTDIVQDEPEKAAATVAALLNPEFGLVSGAGLIKTLEVGALRHREGGYHTGTCWPHDNGLAAFGLFKWGFYGAAWKVAGQMNNVVAETNTIPENLHGGAQPVPVLDERNIHISTTGPLGEERDNCIEQRPQRPQGFAAVEIAWTQVQWSKAVLGLPGAYPWVATDPTKRALEVQVLTKFQRILPAHGFVAPGSNSS